jgi:hypothetical protein
MGTANLVVKDTGGRARPLIAPGAVVYEVDGVLMFLMLSSQGEAESDAISLELDYASPGGFIRHDDGYLLVGGFGELQILDLKSDGSVRRKLPIARGSVLDNAVICSSQGKALVAWKSQDTNAVHTTEIDLKSWQQGATIDVSASEAIGQSPVISRIDGVWWIAWGESAGGPMAPRLARVQAGPSLSDVYQLKTGGAGPAFPTGFLPGDEAPNVVILRSGAKSALALARAPQGDVVPIVDLQPIMVPEYASAICRENLVVVIGQQQLTFFVCVGRDGLILCRDALSTHELRSRAPTVAADATRLWFAWEQFLDGGAGSSVAVDVRSRPEGV